MSAQRPPSVRSAASDYLYGRHNQQSSISSMASIPNSTYDSRRDTNGSSSTPRARKQSPAVESAVTRLLVAIKQLLEALTQWSTGKVSEDEVSNVYVRLGNDFNAAVAAFEQFGIGMSELKAVPDDLRDVLERCLAEDASPENLDLYLPNVRKIITSLLQGLRSKQTQYRARGNDRQRSRSELSYNQEGTPDDSRASRASNSSQISRGSSTTSDTERTLSGRRKVDGGRRAGAVSDSERWTSSSKSADVPVPPIPKEGSSSSRTPNSKTSSRRQVSHTQPATDSPNTHDSDGDIGSTRTGSRKNRKISPLASESSVKGEASHSMPPSSTNIVVPPEVKRYSLVDAPMGFLAGQETSPSQQSSPVEQVVTSVRPPTPDAPSTPGVESSLAALKQSEALQRRASKRFSTYTFSKMTGSTQPVSLPVGGQPKRTLAAGSNLTAGDLAALAEVDEDEPPVQTNGTTRRGMSHQRSIEKKRNQLADESSQYPVIPAPPQSSSLATSRSATPTQPIAFQESTPTKSSLAGSNDNLTAPSLGPSSSKDNTITVFLQIGRQVKKVTVEQVHSFSALRVMFVDRFSYNPGQDNFPAIYIRDPSSGVQYELEDVREVKDKCLLSLNIEPLDQIKQHIDMQITHLSQEIKDLKTSFTASKRLSIANGELGTIVSGASFPSRPTERQFQSVARHITRMQSRANPTLQPIVAQNTGASDISNVSPRIVADLKTQFDEVQNIRRDLGVMRQIYVDFFNSTKEALNALRTQATAVRQTANSKVGGARASINAGKAMLDKRSQNVLTDIEDVQDTVENLKDDVLKRHVTPKLDVMKRLRAKVDAIAKELEDLSTHITTIRPAWKKTWEEELQNIVEEQQFLTHQEELISDLLEDHKALSEVFGHVEKVISIRGSGSGRSRGFRPPPLDEGHSGLSTVMLEIRGAQIDPEKRMKAIEASQRIRQKELANRPDEFQSELVGFVAGKKLKMTGGAEEVERVRQKKNDQAFKAMFTPEAIPGHTFSSAPPMDSDEDDIG